MGLIFRRRRGLSSPFRRDFCGLHRPDLAEEWESQKRIQKNCPDVFEEVLAPSLGLSIPVNFKITYVHVHPAESQWNGSVAPDWSHSGLR